MKKKMVKLKPRRVDNVGASVRKDSEDGGIGARILADLEHKPRKIAKTFSVADNHYALLEKWCEAQGNSTPSSVVDSLIKMFLIDQGLI